VKKLKAKIFFIVMFVALSAGLFFAACQVKSLENITEQEELISLQEKIRPKAVPAIMPKKKKPQKILVKVREERKVKREYTTIEELTPQQKKLVELGFNPFAQHSIGTKQK
jgi:hypothetical protein